MYEYLQIGKIVNTHGIKGEIRIIPLTDDPMRFRELKWVYVETKNTDTDSGVVQKYTVNSVKFLNKFVIVKFEGVNDMTAAELLRGLFVCVDRENAVKLPENSYFICDLIGCEIFDEKSKSLGILRDIIKTGSNDVYVVANKTNGREVLIPAIKSVVSHISIKDKIINVKLPKGLMDDEV